MVFVEQTRGSIEADSQDNESILSATSPFRKVSNWNDKVSGGESEELD